MRRFYFTLILMAIVFACKAESMPYTTLEYQVHWNWGLININAGNATVTLQCQGNDFSGTLSGQSVPWEGRIYSISDTLKAEMNPTIENVSYINGYYRKPRVNSVQNDCSPKDFATILGEGTLSASNATMEAVSITADMVNIFYYARTINFDDMTEGDVVEVDIVKPGITDGAMRVVYNGEGTTSEGEDVYKATLTYSFDGQMSEYPVNVEISKSSRLPLSFSSNIKIGHVQMHLIR